jgi:hypothetical protein
MKKRTLLTLAAAAAVLLVPAGGFHVQAAQRGSTCTLTGKAKFTPGLSSTLQPTKYTFAGKLTDCQSTDGKLHSGTVSASGGGSVSCGTGSTAGKATILWNNGKKTLVKFNTYDAAALAELAGQVTGGTETAFKKGDEVVGSLAFNADATKCAAGGIKSAVFQGQVGGGSPS